MRQKRNITEVKEKEVQLKRQKRSDPKVKEMEAEWKAPRYSVQKQRNNSKHIAKTKSMPRSLQSFE